MKLSTTPKSKLHFERNVTVRDNYRRTFVCRKSARAAGWVYLDIQLHVSGFLQGWGRYLSASLHALFQVKPLACRCQHTHILSSTLGLRLVCLGGHVSNAGSGKTFQNKIRNGSLCLSRVCHFYKFIQYTQCISLETNIHEKWFVQF